ncbi:MAG TPA: LytR C-terminal domain-containing protein [Actinopolymorphaceae bacterium]
MIVLLGLLFGAAWYGWKSVIDVPPAPQPTQVCSTPKADKKQRIDAKHVIVNVYNDSQVTGLAQQTADTLSLRGFTIGKVANNPYDHKVKTVEIRGRHKQAPEVLLLREQLKGQVTIQDDSRSDTSVDLIIGGKWSGLAGNAPTAMEVDTEVPVCVTKMPTPVAAGLPPS